MCAGAGEVAEAAARLARADLATSLVTEMTGLAGTMGRHYALQSGTAPDVAEVGALTPPTCARGLGFVKIAVSASAWRQSFIAPSAMTQAKNRAIHLSWLLVRSGLDLRNFYIRCYSSDLQCLACLSALNVVSCCPSHSSATVLKDVGSSKASSYCRSLGNKIETFTTSW